MKKLCLLLILFSTINISQAQQIIAKKPAYVLILNDTLTSDAKVQEYMSTGYLKSMNKGVSEEERNRLAQKLGDKIGEKEFIIVFELFTESEKQQRSLAATAHPMKKNTAAIHTNEVYLVKPNEPARDFSLAMIDGTQVKLSELKGKVVLINFWATWCAPCLMEFYDIPPKILTPFKDSPFVFLPISIGETKEKVAGKMKQLAEKGIRFNAGFDPTQVIWNQYASGAIPRNFLVDQNGVVRYVSSGNTDTGIDKLAAEINKLLNK